MNASMERPLPVQHVYLRRRAHSDSPDGSGAGLANKVFIALHVGFGVTVVPHVCSSNEAATAGSGHAQLGPHLNEIQPLFQANVNK